MVPAVARPRLRHELLPPGHESRIGGDGDLQVAEGPMAEVVAEAGHHHAQPVGPAAHVHRAGGHLVAQPGRLSMRCWRNSPVRCITPRLCSIRVCFAPGNT